jgi:hypothetical protein
MNSINTDAKFFLISQMLKIELLQLDSAKVGSRRARKYTEKWSHTSIANHGCRYNFPLIQPSPILKHPKQRPLSYVQEHFRLFLKSGIMSTALTSEFAMEDI